MTNLATDPVAATALVACAAYIMISAGAKTKRLSFRVTTCPVCRHTRATCTCRWR